MLPGSGQRLRCTNSSVTAWANGMFDNYQVGDLSLGGSQDMYTFTNINAVTISAGY